MSTSSTGPQGPGPGAPAPIAGVRVLVVDDDMDVRILASNRLERHGFIVHSVESGEAALLALDEIDVDLVLLDYRLPGRDGLETLRLLRARQGPSVVLATGDGSERVAVEAMRAGAVDYLGKNNQFLEQLPVVMERAWRTHDLSRRTEELQRQALLVTSGVDRTATLEGIVQGAHSLLRSQGCALFTSRAGEVGVEASAGQVPDAIDDITFAARAMLDQDDHEGGFDLVAEHALLMPLGRAGVRPLGALALFLARTRTLELSDLRLAEVFASFAGIAMANLDRFALEEEMVARLQDLVQTRRQLLTSMGHELRTPLTCIRGFTSTLLNHGDALTPELRQESLEAVLSHTDELSRLVEQLLAAAEAEQGRVSVRVVPTELPGVVKTSVSLLAPLLGEREVALDLRDLTVLADPVLLRRVLANLMTNAIKYSPDDAPIDVRITEVDETWAAIEVVDRGPGLDKHEQTRVFEPFWRTSGPLRDQVRGAGVGLALVQEYVAVMGGRVEVASELGEGSTFSVHLRRTSTPERSD